MRQPSINDIINDLLPDKEEAADIIRSSKKTGALVIDEVVKREKLTYEQIASHIASKYGFRYALTVEGTVKKRDRVEIVTDSGRFSWFPFYLDDVDTDIYVVPKNVFDNVGYNGTGQVSNAGVSNRIYSEMMEEAIKMDATDIHIDHRENTTVIYFRIDGEKWKYRELSTADGQSLSKYIVILCNETSNVKFDEMRVPQDGRLSYRGYDLRVAFMPAHYGYKVSIRLLKRFATVDTFDSLGFLSESKNIIETYLRKTYGLIIVTGPTGSGKSRTLSVCLKSIDREKKNVLTIEDPIEYVVYGVNQSQVHLWEEDRELVGYDFKVGARSFLRHDPDVCLIGEIRDQETAEAAIELANTGHLVLTTLHTNTSYTAPIRLLSGRIMVDRYSLASSLLLVVGQRLVKKLCPSCRTRVELTKEHLRKFYIQDRTPFDSIIGQSIWTANSNGCEKCKKGYIGRTVIEEIMIVDDNVRKIITTGNANPEELKRFVTISFVESIIERATAGVVDLFQVCEIIS